MKFKFYALKLSAIIILVFILQMIFSGLTDLFMLTGSAWIQPWRFVTAIFLHGSLPHLVLNMFGLILFGNILEKLVGEKKFLLVFFISGILANLISVNFYASSLGASGAIYGVLGALIIVRPLLPIFAFGLPMPIFIAGILWAIGDFLGVYGFGASGIGNIAHLFGMAIGMAIGFGHRMSLDKRQIQNPRVILDEREVRRWEDDYMRN